MGIAATLVAARNLRRSTLKSMDEPPAKGLWSGISVLIIRMGKLIHRSRQRRQTTWVRCQTKKHRRDNERAHPYTTRVGHPQKQKPALRKLGRPKWLCHGTCKSLRSPRRKTLAARPELQAAALKA